MTIRVQSARVERLLDKAQRRSKNLMPVWGDLNANVIQPEMQRRFRASGAAHGRRWTPLRPSTRRQRLTQRGGNRGGIARPLWDTGRLRGSWVKRGPESVYSAKRLSFERGTSVPYAAAHQNGTARLPARPIVTPEFADMVSDRAADRIAKFIVDDD